MTSVILYGAALLLLFVSTLRDRAKTKKSLLIAWKSFSKLFPTVLAMMFFIGSSLSLLNQETISRILGSDSGLLGTALALFIGSIISMPSFVAFPLGGALLGAGAGYMQVAAFVSTIMAVGFVSLPIEIKYFGKAIALRRIVLSFVICVVFTAVIGMVM